MTKAFPLMIYLDAYSRAPKVIDQIDQAIGQKKTVILTLSHIGARPNLLFCVMAYANRHDVPILMVSQKAILDWVHAKQN